MSVFLGCVAQISQQAYSAVHSFFAFCGFVLYGSANSQHCPNNKNISLESFNRQEHQNCLTLEQVFRPYCIMFNRDGGGAGAAPPHHTISAKKYYNIGFWTGAFNYSRIFAVQGLETFAPQKARDQRIHFTMTYTQYQQ